MVFELRPTVHVDKGVVLTRLWEETRAEGIIYIGDDVTDIDAFRAIHQIGRGVTLAVGVRSAEAPPALLKAADVLVDGVPGVRELLSALDSLD